jgi:hypothetical protein
LIDDYSVYLGLTALGFEKYKELGYFSTENEEKQLEKFVFGTPEEQGEIVQQSVVQAGFVEKMQVFIFCILIFA